nr:hypothetical protein [uncultured Eisenbergiella sp.]
MDEKVVDALLERRTKCTERRYCHSTAVFKKGIEEIGESKDG